MSVQSLNGAVAAQQQADRLVAARAARSARNAVRRAARRRFARPLRPAA